jgi:hypothetical protein
LSAPLIDDEGARLAEACRALSDPAAGAVVVDGLLAAGMQSRVWRLAAVGPAVGPAAGPAGGPAAGPAGAREYAVKWFRPGYRRTGDVVAREYSALLDLSRALRHVPAGGYRLSCPVPARQWDWGYAMSVVAGLPLEDLLGRRLPDRDLDPIAADLVGALLAFHAEAGRPYGDFHPRNVLLGPDRDLYLVDPTHADVAFYAWQSEAPSPHLAVDIAYWLYWTAHRALRRSLRRPATTAGCYRLAHALYEAAAAHSPDGQFAGHVDRCLAGYWSILGRNGYRQRALAALASRRHAYRFYRTASRPR